MEMIAEPQLVELESSRFRVPVFPFYVYSRAVVSKDGTISSGHGFDRSKRVSHAKAHSEAIERWVFDHWEKTGISPFTGKFQPCPPSTTGFAAGPSQDFAKAKAFNEFCERAFLQQIADGAVKLTEVAPPAMGLIFYPLLAANKLALRCFRSESTPYFSFSVIELSEGVLFGSSCDTDHISATRASVLEAVKKLSHVEFWRSKDAEAVEPSSFLKTARYWLSVNGKIGMIEFLNRAVSIKGSGPTKIRNDYCFNILQIGSSFVAHYADDLVKLPMLGDIAVPLL
jgi:hypothetical protein